MSLPPQIRAQLIEALARLLLKDLDEAPDQPEPEEEHEERPA